MSYFAILFVTHIYSYINMYLFDWIDPWRWDLYFRFNLRGLMPQMKICQRQSDVIYWEHLCLNRKGKNQVWEYEHIECMIWWIILVSIQNIILFVGDIPKPSYSFTTDRYVDRLPAAEIESPGLSSVSSQEITKCADYFCDCELWAVLS